MRKIDDGLPLPTCRRYVNRHRWRGVIGYLIMGAVMLVAVGKAQNAENRTEPYRPLSNYPTAQILDRVPGHTGPALATPPHGESILHVVPRVCNRHGSAVNVRSSLAWVPYTASDAQILGAAFSLYSGIDEVRPPGCSRFNAAHPFVTPVPVTVATENRVLHVDHWRLLLADTPTKSDGTLGVRATGYTEPFRLIPTG